MQKQRTKWKDWDDKDRLADNRTKGLRHITKSETHTAPAHRQRARSPQKPANYMLRPP